MKTKSMNYDELSQLKTPSFVIDSDALETNLHQFKSALERHWGTNSELSYSIKTNPFFWILDTVKKCNCIAEAVSDEEYQFALQRGFVPENIVFNGPIKSEAMFKLAVSKASIVNIDSARELRWLAELSQTNPQNSYEVGLRVNVDLDSIVPDQTVTKGRGSRFGFCNANGELKSAIKKVRSLPNVSIAGLHMHITTLSRSLDVYELICRQAIEVVGEHNLLLNYIDIGGGFYGGGEVDGASYNAYAERIASVLKTTFDPEKTKLIVEPGGSVICTPVKYLGRVIDAKQTNYTRVVTTDLSRLNIDHEMKKDSYDLEVYFKGDSCNRKLASQQLICGFTCMDSDRLCYLNNKETLEEGDIIVINNAGAYSMSFSPAFFIRRFPTVYAKLGGGTYIE